MPKVSVLMTVYKTNETYLKEAINSILNQTFQDFELLILDDCPAEPRTQIVNDFQDKRIRYILNEKNEGISHARNKLIDLAQGEYLAVFDHDDISLPERLDKQVTYLDEHPIVGVVGCFAQIFGRRSKLLTYPTEDHDIKLSLMYNCKILHPASMIRKSVLTENNISYENDFTPGEDYRLWTRLIDYTNFHNIPEILFHYRDHNTNTSKTKNKKMSENTHTIRAEVQEKHPVLYREYLSRVCYRTQIKLFKRIPLITTVTKNRQTDIFLFHKIKIITIKRSFKFMED